VVSRASAVAAIVALAIPAATSAGTPQPAPSAPTRSEAWIARIAHPTVARSEPGGGEVLMRVDGDARWAGGPVALLVLAARADAHGREWLRVRLPVRPNLTAGWIRADFVKLTRTPYRIEVSVGKRRVRLLHAGRVLRAYEAVVGTPYWPTPKGLFAVSERVPQPDPAGFLGPWALLVTAYSPTLSSFGGGPGQIALHGRAGASLDDPLGSARSHGCIRIPNRAIRLLARLAREGTPVHITP
jgi:lipoprotein-anchoring transpeptidase ErfK/SrfK